MKLLTIFASLGLAAVAFGIPQFAQLAAQTHDISGPDPVNTTNSIDITNSTNPVEATNQIGSPDRVDTANAIDSPDYAYTQTDQWWLRCDYCRFHNNKCKKVSNVLSGGERH